MYSDKNPSFKHSGIGKFCLVYCIYIIIGKWNIPVYNYLRSIVLCLKFFNLPILLYVLLLSQEVGKKSLWLAINRSFLSKIIITTDANKDDEVNHTFFFFCLLRFLKTALLRKIR